MSTAPAVPTMSKEDFHSSQLYRAVTPRQKLWLDVFTDSQDAALATKTAYGDQTDPAYRAMLTRKIETSPRVIAALDLFYCRTPKEKFLRDLQLDIARSKGIAKIEGRRLYAKVTGLDGSPSGASVLDCGTVEASKVGDIVLVDGVKYSVTAVNASGKPTEGEPL